MEHGWGTRFLSTVEKQNPQSTISQVPQETIQDVAARFAAENAQSLAQAKVLGLMAMAQGQLEADLGQLLCEQLQILPIPREAQNAVSQEILQLPANFLSQPASPPTKHNKDSQAPATTHTCAVSGNTLSLCRFCSPESLTPSIPHRRHAPHGPATKLPQQLTRAQSVEIHCRCAGFDLRFRLC